MDVTRNIAEGFRAEILARVLYFSASGATLVFLARFLEPGAYGLLFLAISILGVGRLFGNLGVSNSAARFIAQYGESDPDRVGPIVGFALRFVIVSMAVVTLAVAALHDHVAAVFGEPELGPLLLVGSALVVTGTLYRYFRKVLQGFKDVEASATVYAAEGVGRLAFVVLLVLAGFGAVGALGGYVLGFGVAAAVGAVLLVRHVDGSDLRERIDADSRREVLRYAIPLFATRGAKVLDNRFDTIIVGFLLAPVAVSYYVLSKQVVHFLQAPAHALGFSVGPWFGDQKAAGNVERISDIYRSVLAHTLLVYVPATAGLVLLARPAITIVFGEAYAPAAGVLQILAVLAALRGVEEVSENALDYLGRARARSVAKGATAIANVSLILVLAPTFGVVGAAVAKVATHAAYVLTTLYIMHTEVTVRSRSLARDVALILLVSGAMSAVVLASADHVSGLATLAGVVALGGAVWALLAVLVGLLDLDAVGSLLDR